MKWRIAAIVLAVLLAIGGAFCGIRIVKLEADYAELQWEDFKLWEGYQAISSKHQILQSKCDALLGLRPDYNELKLEIDEWFTSITGDGYYPAWTLNAQSGCPLTVEQLVGWLQGIAQYYTNTDWGTFCEWNNIAPAEAAAFIEWLAECEYDGVRIVYQTQQADLAAWVYFPKTKEGETVGNVTLDGDAAFLHSTQLFIGAPSFDTIGFDSIYTACYALDVDTFSWWREPQGRTSVLYIVTNTWR